MLEKKRKGVALPHYDDVLKAGAIRMVTEQKRPVKDVAQVLGVCIDMLKSWLRRAGHRANPTNPSYREAFRRAETRGGGQDQ